MFLLKVGIDIFVDRLLAMCKVFSKEDITQVVPAGMPEVLRVRVYGAGVPVPGCGVLSLCSNAESSDCPAAPGAHGETHVRCG